MKTEDTSSACVIFEDDHLLVVSKPAHVNTHAPSPYAGEGIYDWLRNREPRWATLAIIHRLDKETSGIMVFSKTTVANRSLTDQFTRRQVSKRYLFLTDHSVPTNGLTVVTQIVRAGDKYRSTSKKGEGERAETHFHPVQEKVQGKYTLVEAHPITGRTHQIRVHAAESGFPVLGDTLYGGSPFGRVCLHALEIELEHPATGKQMTFSLPPDFCASSRDQIRSAFVDSNLTTAFRIRHGAADGTAGVYADKLGDYLHVALDPDAAGTSQIHAICDELQGKSLPGKIQFKSVYHKILNRHVRQTRTSEVSPQLVFGEPAPDTFVVQENQVAYELSFKEGYSVGLFLDQRDNRRRCLTGHVASGFPLYSSAEREVLNVFSYTCGFSVCAAKGGAKTTSLDLSKKYLDWGRRNFQLNGMDPDRHDFIYGDAFNWMSRLAKKGRLFDLILLDPPTFSQSKEHGIFRAEKDYGRLIACALQVLQSDGVLFCSTNAAGLMPEQFLDTLNLAVVKQGRKVLQQYYAPQPPDFPVTREEPAYLKTVWLRIGK